MNNQQPKCWWFLLPLPVAMLVSYIIWVIRLGMTSALDIAVIGIVSFPIGLPSLIYEVPKVLRWPTIILGYGLYVALSFTGAKKRSMNYLFALCVLLAMNVEGCHTDRAVANFEIRPQNTTMLKRVVVE